MNRSLKKRLSFLLATVICLSMFNVAFTGFAEDLVAINDTNFPDAGFRELVSQNYDENSDGYLNEAERSSTYMTVSGMINTSETVTSVKSLAGIEYFPNITVLRCGGIGLEELDVSRLIHMESLTCHGNSLTSLNLGSNYSLEFLNCSDNNISNLILPTSSATTTIYCYANSIKEIDLSRVPNLQELRCDQNELTSLDLNSSTKLQMLNCSSNHLSSLDLSKTAVTEATDYEIGDQNIDVEALLEDGKIIVPFNNKGVIINTNYRGCSLDVYGDGSCYEGDRFAANEVSQIKDGITYECYPMLTTAENMTVHINVIHDFRQVDFYTDDTLTDRIGYSVVNNGGTASAPEIVNTPQCKAFDRWSDDFSNVSADMQIYALWRDNHNYNVKLNSDKDTVSVNCTNGDSDYQVSFLSIVNSKVGDSRFDANVDVVKDNCINAKDYSKLLNAME